MENFLNLQELLGALQVDPQTAQDPVKRMFLFSGAHLTVNIATGADMGNSLHTQPAHEEVIVVLEGDADFRVGNEMRRVRTGDIIFIPSNTLHGRERTHSEKWAALSIYGPQFDLSKRNILWDKDGNIGSEPGESA